MLDTLIKIWSGNLELPGSAMLTLLVLNLTFMLFGRFRFCLISIMIFGYYILFFANRQMVEGDMSKIGNAGAMIISGAVFLGICVWSFFIDMD